MHDLMIRNAHLPDGRSGVDILVRQGRIEVMAERLPKISIPEIDANGDLLSTPFVDAHFHMDAVLSYGLPRVNPVRNAVGRNRAMGRTQAYADAGSADCQSNGILRLGDRQRLAGDTFTCRYL
jgi:cytosine/adenosine deaminase-related metal-dependent hydrolase